MSLLNLNSPAGQSPRGKKSLKMWMGAGLIAAVLGIGSTFAANITLNTPEGTTEFGQGVTQTVYCGGDQSVTVAPVSSYTNTNSIVKVKLVDTESSTKSVPTWARTAEQTINGNSSSSFPKFTAKSSSITGWWIKTSSATSEIPSSRPGDYPADINAGLNATGWMFVQKTGTNEYKVGDSSGDWSEPLVSLSGGSTNFKLGGVVISKIPSDCTGVNFVVSSFGSTGNAQSLVSDVSLVAARWTGSGSVSPSKSRKCFSSASGITASQNGTSLEFTISNGLVTANDVSRLVIETQEDALTSNPC